MGYARKGKGKQGGAAGSSRGRPRRQAPAGASERRAPRRGRPPHGRGHASARRWEEQWEEAEEPSSEEEEEEEESSEDGEDGDGDSDTAAAAPTRSDGSVADEVCRRLVANGAFRAVVGKRRHAEVGQDEVEMELYTEGAAKKARLIRDEPCRRRRVGAMPMGGSIFESLFGF